MLVIVGAPCEEPGGVNECGAICLSKEQGNELVRGGGVVAAWYRYYVSKWGRRASGLISKTVMSTTWLSGKQCTGNLMAFICAQDLALMQEEE